MSITGLQPSASELQMILSNRQSDIVIFFYDDPDHWEILRTIGKDLKNEQ